MYKIKTVDIALTKRSRKEFFRDAKSRSVKSLEDTSRDISKKDAELDQGYTTQCGIKGGKLSGGQK